MTTIRPEITGRVAGANDVEPLAVSPRQACFLLSVGTTRLYELIRAGELQAYYEGRARRITVESIRARLARLLSPLDPGSPMIARSPCKNAIRP